MVEQSSHNPTTEGSNRAPSSGKEKVGEKGKDALFPGKSAAIFVSVNESQNSY